MSTASGARADWPQSVTLTASQLADLNHEKWYCLRTHRKHEHLAANALKSLLSVEAFAPRIRYRKVTRRGGTWFVEAMFPGYIFARFDFCSRHRAVQHAPGVAGLLRFGERVAALPDETIDGLRMIVGGDQVLEFHAEMAAGDEVQVLAGAFQGFAAVVTRLIPAGERIGILLEVMGRSIEAVTDRSNVLPTRSARDTLLSADPTNA